MFKGSQLFGFKVIDGARDATLLNKCIKTY